MSRLLIAGALLLTACASLLGPDGAVRASEFQGSINLVNDTRSPIYFFAISENDAPLALWAPCTDPASCEGVAARSSRLVPFPVRFGTQQPDDALLYWWHLLPKSGGGYEPDSIRVIGVKR